MKIILIDDDKDEIDIFAFALEKLDTEVDFTGFTNFEKAFDYLIANDLPNYIFLDGFMNVISGEEGLQRIKTHNALRTIPVIIYSGFVSEQDIEKLMQLGADGVLIKPSLVESLRESLQKLFSEGSL